VSRRPAARIGWKSAIFPAAGRRAVRITCSLDTRAIRILGTWPARILASVLAVWVSGLSPFPYAEFGAVRAVLALPLTETGSLQISNILEYQIGWDPTNLAEEDELSQLFDQFVLDYTRGDLRLGLRWESYRDSKQQSFGAPDYDELTQKYVEWSQPDLIVRVGNGYAILGRGLLFRAFELPGVIRDANFPASRYAESRDLDGVILEARHRILSLTAISGRPVSAPDIPYGAEEQFVFRRSGTVSGGHLGLDIGRGVRLGAAYLRTDDLTREGREDQGGADLELRLGRLLPRLDAAGLDLRFYGEYAGRRWRPFSDGLTTRDGRPHALYTATEFTYGLWGLSFETKRYHQFALLVNDPPSAVPEHSYHLLNRSTHVLAADDETGHQLSLQGALPRGWLLGAMPPGWLLQADWAQAVNRSFTGAFYERAKRYNLALLSLESPPRARWQATLIAAAGRDEIIGITDHHLFGTRLLHSRDDGWSVELTVEFQAARRRVVTPLVNERQDFDNLFASVGMSKAGLGSLALQGEWSNDPLEKDDPRTQPLETAPRAWYGAVANIQINAYHEATLFAGERRGGTACTSGTCYEVPDFSGAELRLTSRF
jgi:hypothetical protein